jgi:hypothetical protein
LVELRAYVSRRFQTVGCPDGVNIECVRLRGEAIADVRDRRQVVDLCRLYPLCQLVDGECVCNIAIDNLRALRLLRWLFRSAARADNMVALAYQKLCQVVTVLPKAAGYQCGLQAALRCLFSTE